MSATLALKLVRSSLLIVACFTVVACRLLVRLRFRSDRLYGARRRIRQAAV